MSPRDRPQSPISGRWRSSPRIRKSPTTALATRSTWPTCGGHAPTPGTLSRSMPASSHLSAHVPYASRCITLYRNISGYISTYRDISVHIATYPYIFQRRRSYPDISVHHSPMPSAYEVTQAMPYRTIHPWTPAVPRLDDVPLISWNKASNAHIPGNDVLNHGIQGCRFGHLGHYDFSMAEFRGSENESSSCVRIPPEVPVNIVDLRPHTGDLCPRITRVVYKDRWISVDIEG